MQGQVVKQVRDSNVHTQRNGRWKMILGQTTPIFASLKHKATFFDAGCRMKITPHRDLQVKQYGSVAKRE